MLNGYKTYIGIALAFIAGLAASLGVQPEPLPDWVDQVFVIIGSVMAIVGRLHKEVRAPE